MAAGLVLAAVGFGMLTQIDRSFGLAVLVTASVAYSLGIAPVFTLASDLIVSSAPPERAGAASAISETSSELGGALGIAILGSIGAAVYRSHVSNAIPPGIPLEAAESARSTLGGAVAAATRLPEQLGAALLDVSREAFTQALQFTALIAALGTIGTAILAAVMLRRVRGRSAPEGQPAPEQAVSQK
jgi:DHA2 family multidrug resistance protein-like MFS transporter